MENTNVPAPAPAVAPAYVTYADFLKMKLRTGKIVEAAAHPNADKLLVLKVDLGDKTIQLVAGIKASYAPESLPGKIVVVLENLEPKPLRGVESQGMMLCATVDGLPVILSPEKDAPAGCVVK
jgi:methionyl-tRNA synthetase